MNEQEALGLVRHLIVIGVSKEDALNNDAVPPEYRNTIRASIEREENIFLEPARMFTDGVVSDWYQKVDRSEWYYWPTLRSFLLSQNWLPQSVNALDETTDRIMRRLPDSREKQFDVRGLVLGYIQSGKTANYTATIAKAADCGYRLVIVLAGIDKGLRMQTQIRLNRELIGYGSFTGDSNHVPIPPPGRQWHSFTTSAVDGDFDPGSANQAALQGPGPVVMVVKKNGAVLRRVITWLRGTSKEILRDIPVLVVDDEADIASIDTRGTYQTEDEPLPQDYEHPSVINGLIRDLLKFFLKSVYIAYTATPFANILIPHDTYDPERENDLYPKDFIVDLPKPPRYFGAEELFGIDNPDGSGSDSGIDVIRTVSDEDVQLLEKGSIPRSLEDAILSFILSGAARAYRGDEDRPATMLIHTSHRIESHMNLAGMVSDKFSEFRNDWRYSENPSIFPWLKDMWEKDFRPLFRTISPQYDTEFDELKKHVGRFMESVRIRTLNSFTGAVLDYSREPHLKAICIGGNKLARGLTLEGLVSSYFVRSSPNYDTLMQMARWFGFRERYVDITRIWTTKQLADQFAHLAFVEHQLRDDIRVYEEMQLTPKQVGMRIWQHPSMQVTSYLKRRNATPVYISQSYSGTVVQTFKFPFDRPEELITQEKENLRATEVLISELGEPEWDSKGPVWQNVSSKVVLKYLNEFRQSDFPDRSGFSMSLVHSYIEKQNVGRELTRWTVSVRGRESAGENLGETSWKVQGKSIRQISRTRIPEMNSVGVITSPGDEATGLDSEEHERFDEIKARNKELGENRAARMARFPENGLLLIYPISRNSKPTERGHSRVPRVPLFDVENGTNATDLIAVAISFPSSREPQQVQAYLTGTRGWRPYDEGS